MQVAPAKRVRVAFCFVCNGMAACFTFATEKNLSCLDALNDAMVHRRSNIAPQPALLSQQPYLPGNGGAVSENRANFVDIEKGRLFPTARASEADGAARLSVEGVVDGADRQICEECKKSRRKGFTPDKNAGTSSCVDSAGWANGYQEGVSAGRLSPL